MNSDHRVGAGHFPLLESPGPTDEIIQRGGQNLSGGQRQRLTLARALYQDSAILILDEPTSALDPEAGPVVEKKLVQIGSDRLVILVTHNLPAVLDADMIVVLEKGEVCGIGTHRELMIMCDNYRKLWRGFERIEQSPNQQ